MNPFEKRGANSSSTAEAVRLPSLSDKEGFFGEWEAALIERSTAVIEKALASGDGVMRQRARALLIAFLLRGKGEVLRGSR